MIRGTQTLGAPYFDALYAADPDPWRFATSPYERAKYRATLAALKSERASMALEIGCSIGVLTQKLATCCDHLVATDLSAKALCAAQARCGRLSNVEFRLAGLSNDPLPGEFDLIILSEVAYYWDDLHLCYMASQIRRSLLPGGRVLLVHWLGKTDYPQSADGAVRRLWARLRGGLQSELYVRRPKYRLDLWRRG